MGVNHTTSSCPLKQCSQNLYFLFLSFSSLIPHLDSSLVEENLRVNVDQTETVQDSDLVEDIVEKHLTQAAIGEICLVATMETAVDSSPVPRVSMILTAMEMIDTATSTSPVKLDLKETDQDTGPEDMDRYLMDMK